MKLTHAYADRAHVNGPGRRLEARDRRHIARRVEMSAIHLRRIPVAIRPDA